MATTWVAVAVLVGFAVQGAVVTRWRAAARVLGRDDATAAARAVALAALATVLQLLGALVCLSGGGLALTEVEMAASLGAMVLGGFALHTAVRRPLRSPTSR